MSVAFSHYSGKGVSRSETLGHSIDESFLCGWECEYRLHCCTFIYGRDLSAHLREAHGIHGSDKDRVKCRWNSCNREFNKESLARHVEEVHMVIVYSCDQCGNTFSRKDTLGKHKRTCSGWPNANNTTSSITQAGSLLTLDPSEIKFQDQHVLATAAKPNYHAREETPVGSSRPPNTHINRVSLQQTTSAALPAAAVATGTPSHLDITIRQAGFWTRFLLWVGCVSFQYTDSHH